MKSCDAATIINTFYEMLRSLRYHRNCLLYTSEFGLWGELDNIVCGTRCHHEQDGERKQMIIDGEAGVRYQDRRPSEVRAAKDGNDHCDQEAEENGESTEARRRLRVDASFGWVVDGVETYGQALCCRCCLLYTSISMTAEETAKRIKKSQTDSERMITFDPENRPGVSGLLSTAAIGTGRSEIEIAEEIGMGGSGQLKKYVTEAVNNYCEPIRERRHRFENDLDYVKDVLAEGNRRANEIAKATLAEVAEAMGMVDVYKRQILARPASHA